MAISILNNIASLAAQNQLSITQTNLNKTLEQTLFWFSNQFRLR